MAHPLREQSRLEQDRLEALRCLRILDSSPEPHLNAVCRLAADLFDVPIALVLLVDEARVWFKARSGVEGDGIDREGAFCDLTSGRVDHASTCQRYRLKDGTWVFMDVCQSLARDPATGAPAGYVTSLRDITARKADERRIANLALVKRSDAVLYRAKAGGRNTYRIGDSAAESGTVPGGPLTAEMRGAMKRGDFLLNYQPIIDLATGGFARFEALLRWRHPRKGELPPSAFIPLGAWMLKEACREAAMWPVPLKIAVNVSAIQFPQISMEETVLHALAASGLAPHRLEPEITETMLMQKTDAVCSTMERLRRLGVRIALDDFGTGYSSLSYLHQFSFDTIKIDRSFVAGMANPRTVAITRAIVALGTSFGARITAEGVETEEHLAFVRAAGCTDVQGFLYDPPLPAGAIAQLIESGRLRLAA